MVLNNIKYELISGLNSLLNEYKRSLDNTAREKNYGELINLYIYSFNEKNKLYNIYNNYVADIFNVVLDSSKVDKSKWSYEQAVDYNNMLNTITNYVFFFIREFGVDNFNKNKKLSSVANKIDISKISLDSSSRYLTEDIVDRFVATLSILKDEDECFSALDRSIEKTTSGYWYRGSSSMISLMMSCKDKNSDRLISYVENIIKKKPTWELRRDLYTGIIISGLLNKSIARKMRSDQSERASLAALKALMSNKDRYSNYSDLVSKFCDTTHHDVACYLARNLDKNLLINMLGNQMYNVKDIVQSRMTESL